jgi:signal transduction histidine kinase
MGVEGSPGRRVALGGARARALARPAEVAFERAEVVLAAAAAMAAVVYMLRLAEPDPETGVSYLYAVPVALVAARFGWRGGVATAAASELLVLAWTMHGGADLPAAAAASRGVTFFALGLVVGWIADSLRRKGRALQASEEARRRMLGDLLRAEDEARARIAAELHDDVIQVMAAALLSADRVCRLAANGDAERVSEATRAVHSTLSGALERTRRLTFELRPPLLEASGVGAAVRQLADEAGRAAGFAVTADVVPDRFPEPVERLLYQMAQEAVANARKHSGACNLAVTVRAQDGWVEAVVRDDGTGFDVDRARDRSRTRLHLGLDLLAERAQLAGGTIDLESAPGMGTRVTIRIPTEL